MRLVLVLSAALVLAPGLAHAQKGGSRNAKELVKQALRLYDQKKFMEAVELLQQAYELSPDTRIIYNIAYAYDQAGKAREAVSYYEKYLVDGEDAQLRKRARSSIDRLRLQQEKETAAAEAAEAEQKRLKAEADAVRQRAEAEQASARRAEEASQLRLKAAYEDSLASRKRMQVTSFVIGGVALAGAGLGVVFGLKARSDVANYKAAPEANPTGRDTARTNALLADIGFGVGLVGAVAAVLLYPKGPPPQPGKAQVTLAPGGLGAGVEVSF